MQFLVILLPNCELMMMMSYAVSISKVCQPVAQSLMKDCDAAINQEV